jgi:2-oxoisovalerate dehydrogenase E2 component (dihydrolipoyl transacylase)
MGRYTFRLPDIGEGIAEAEVVAWHVKVGDEIAEDSRLADVMTDKATVELESPVAGKVIELAVEAGDRLAIGSMLVVLEVEGEGDPSDGPSSGSGRAYVVATSPDSKSQLSATPEIKPNPTQAEPVEAPAQLPAPGAKVLASPAVRARAQALRIDLGVVPPASTGRIGHGELDAFLTRRLPVDKSADKQVQKPVEILAGAGETIKVIGLRRKIAEAMTASKRHIPHFTYVEECDVTALESMRAELNSLHADRPRLTVLPLLIRAICLALPDFPMINARFDDAAGEVTRYASVHLGVATQTDAGLVVPVVRDAQALSLWQLAAEIARLAAAARDGSAKPGELSGSTLSLTSLGPLGGIATTPVINRPEVAIIGPNRIVERAVFMPDGAGGERIEKRKLMNVSISCDHRVVDGWDAANFVQAVKRLLESPMMLLAI